MTDPGVNAASVAIVHNGRVLLIRRARAPLAGLWTLPGGRTEAGENPVDTAVREVREEVGLAVADARQITTLEAGGWRLAVFAASYGGGPVAASDEVADHRWVTRAEAEALETTPGLGDVLRLVPGLT